MIGAVTNAAAPLMILPLIYLLYRKIARIVNTNKTATTLSVENTVSVCIDRIEIPVCSLWLLSTTAPLGLAVGFLGHIF